MEQGCVAERETPGAAAFQALAGALTPNQELQEMLVADMATHLALMRAALPEQDPDFYLRSCAEHARHRLRRTQSTPLVGIPRVVMSDLPSPARSSASVATNPADAAVVLAGVVGAGRTADLMPLLTARQQEVFTLLAVGTGIREAARQLGMSHVAVIKHRRKIARAAQRLPGATAAW